MIFAQRAPLTRAALGAGLRAPPQSDAVKRLQHNLAALSRAASDGNFSPFPDGVTAADGKLYDETIGAVLYAAIKLPNNVAGVSDILNVLGRVPGLGDFVDKVLGLVGWVINSRARAVAGYALLPTDEQTKVRDWIFEQAGTLAVAVGLATAFLEAGAPPDVPQLPGGGTGPSYTALPTQMPTTPVSWPAGVVAVRDPSVGKYRLLVKG